MNLTNILFTTSIIATFFMSFLLDPSLNIRTWLDSLFLVGLILLLTSAILTLIEANFFTAFIRSFRHFYASVSKKEEVVRESEKRENYTFTYQRRFPIRIIFFKIGILFCLISLIASTSIYYFGR